MTVEDRNNRILELLPAIRDVALYVACRYHRVLYRDLTNDVVEFLCTKRGEDLLYKEKRYFYTAIKNRCFEYIKSRRYSDSWGNRFEHLTIENLYERDYNEYLKYSTEDESDEKAMVAEIRKLLSPQDWMIFAGKHYYGFTQRELGELLGCSRSQISKKQTALMEIVRQRLNVPPDRREVVGPIDVNRRKEKRHAKHDS